MKQYSILLSAGTAVLCSTLVFGQTTITTYQPDLNGRQVVMSTSSTTDGQQTKEVKQNINGRVVPREQITEKVLRSDAKSKVTERMIRRLDPNGGLAGTDRVVIEETQGEGGKTVKETIYRSTLNGPMLEEQRTKTETRVAGDTTTTQIEEERSSVNRGFAVSERREIVTKGPATNQQTTEKVMNPDQTGRFVLTQRKESTVTTKGSETTTNTTVYESRGTTDPVLTSQTVETSTKTPDGGQLTEINLYFPAASAGARPELKEQKIVALRTGADGSVTETTSVRLPVSTDTDRLGAARVISETVCQGKCAPEKPAAAQKPPVNANQRK